MPSATIPASLSSLLSSASRNHKQIRNQPVVVDNYPSLELPLQWRNPLPDHFVHNQTAPPLQTHSVTHDSASALPCDPTMLLWAPPEPISPLPSLTRDPLEQLPADFSYQEAHGVVLEKSNGSNSVVLENSGEATSATIPVARRAFHSIVEEGKEEKDVVSKAKKATEFIVVDQVDFEAKQRKYSAENGEDCQKERRTGGVLYAIVDAVQGKKPSEFASDGSDDREAEENRIYLQEINNSSRLRFCRSEREMFIIGRSNVYNPFTSNLDLPRLRAFTVAFLPLTRLDGVELFDARGV